VAGEQAPDVALGGDEAARRKCRDAWAAWWREHGPTVELARPDDLQRLAGQTLILEQFDPMRRGGRVLALDPDNKLRWQIEGLQNPLDVQFLPGDRVLVVEPGAMRVNERDSKGAIVWTKQLVNTMPFSCQRLRNGNTFVACNNRLVEVQPGGNEVFTFSRPAPDIVAAQRLRNGQTAFVTNTGTYTRLDAAGKEVKNIRFAAQNQQFNYGVVQILPDDHVLTAQFAGTSKLVEYDGDGKAVREIPVPAPPSGVMRLPNGHTVVASLSSQRVIQVDPSGKVVWEYKDPTVKPWRARRR
jgi:hypothetical protein